MRRFPQAESALLVVRADLFCFSTRRILVGPGGWITGGVIRFWLLEAGWKWTTVCFGVPDPAEVLKIGNASSSLIPLLLPRRRGWTGSFVVSLFEFGADLDNEVRVMVQVPLFVKYNVLSIEESM